MIFTTKTGAMALGIKQDTLKHYVMKFEVGLQPGGPGTPWIFTLDELLMIRNRAKWDKVEIKEDREILGLGALYNLDKSPRK